MVIWWGDRLKNTSRYHHVNELNLLLPYTYRHSVNSLYIMCIAHNTYVGVDLG